VRVGLALMVLIVNVVALTSILGSGRRTRSRWIWTTAVVLLPFAGALAWFVSDRRPVRVDIRKEA
jgi:hypothetical protein